MNVLLVVMANNESNFVVMSNNSNGDTKNGRYRNDVILLDNISDLRMNQRADPGGANGIMPSCHKSDSIRLYHYNIARAHQNPVTPWESERCHFKAYFMLNASNSGQIAKGGD